MKTFLMKLSIIIFLLSLTGCMGSGARFQKYVDGLNKRQWKGCYANNVNFAGGFGATAAITASGYVLTGGMSAEDCISLRTNRMPGE